MSQSNVAGDGFIRVPGGDYGVPEYEVSGFGTNVADFVVGDFFKISNKQIANGLRYAGNTIGMAGGFMMKYSPVPQGKALGAFAIGLGFTSNFVAELFDSNTKSLLRNSGLDVINHSLPPNPTKDFTFEVYKIILDNFDRENQW